MNKIFLPIRAVTFYQENVNDKVFADDIDFAIKNLSFLQPRCFRVSSIKNNAGLNLLKNKKIWGMSKQIEINKIKKSDYQNEILTDISKNKNIFYSVNINKDDDVTPENLFDITNLIRSVSNLNKGEGYSNFQLGVGFNIKDYTPYFPYSFSSKERYEDITKFSIGLEIVNYVKDLVSKNNRLSIEKLSSLIEKSLINDLEKLQLKISEFCQLSKTKFMGFDISFSPFPYLHGEASVVELIEIIGNLGRSRSKIKFVFGDPGTQFIHTFYTDILKKIEMNENIKTTGFCSLMYSVLEDNLLSNYFSENKIDFRNLFLLSTTCGCGLDMIPLCKNVKDEEIYGYILDTYCLSNKLEKPLGLRLLIDNTKSNSELTSYEDIFFSNLKLQSEKNGPHFLKLPNQVKSKINFFK